MQIESTGKKNAAEPPPLLLPTFTTKKKKNKDFILFIFFVVLPTDHNISREKCQLNIKRQNMNRTKTEKNTLSTAHGKNSKERNSSCEIYIENILLFFNVFVVCFFSSSTVFIANIFIIKTTAAALQ